MHTRLNIPTWRHHLIGYEGSELVQFLDLGFPIGLSEDAIQTLVPSLHHTSSTLIWISLCQQAWSGVIWWAQVQLSSTILQGSCKSTYDCHQKN